MNAEKGLPFWGSPLLFRHMQHHCDQPAGKIMEQQPCQWQRRSEPRRSAKQIPRFSSTSRRHLFHSTHARTHRQHLRRQHHHQNRQPQAEKSPSDNRVSSLAFFMPYHGYSTSHSNARQSATDRLSMPIHEAIRLQASHVSRQTPPSVPCYTTPMYMEQIQYRDHSPYHEIRIAQSIFAGLLEKHREYHGFIVDTPGVA